MPTTAPCSSPAESRDPTKDFIDHTVVLVEKSGIKAILHMCYSRASAYPRRGDTCTVLEYRGLDEVKRSYRTRIGSREPKIMNSACQEFA